MSKDFFSVVVYFAGAAFALLSCGEPESRLPEDGVLVIPGPSSRPSTREKFDLSLVEGDWHKCETQVLSTSVVGLKSGIIFQDNVMINYEYQYESPLCDGTPLTEILTVHALINLTTDSLYQIDYQPIELHQKVNDQGILDSLNQKLSEGQAPWVLSQFKTQNIVDADVVYSSFLASGAKICLGQISGNLDGSTPENRRTAIDSLCFYRPLSNELSQFRIDLQGRWKKCTRNQAPEPPLLIVGVGSNITSTQTEAYIVGDLITLTDSIMEGESCEGELIASTKLFYSYRVFDSDDFTGPRDDTSVVLPLSDSTQKLVTIDLATLALEKQYNRMQDVERANDTVELGFDNWEVAVPVLFQIEQPFYTYTVISSDGQNLCLGLSSETLDGSLPEKRIETVETDCMNRVSP